MTATRKKENDVDQTKNAGNRPNQLFDIESPMAIELRRIMIRIGRQAALDRKRAFMVTSALRGEGKSLFSLHFSLVLAYHLPVRVLLLDADVRRPVQHTVFQAEIAPGFANVLSGDSTVAEAARGTRIKNLDFMPAGTSKGHISRLSR
jgi:Mrp family chromosome partitioning ATPase